MEGVVHFRDIAKEQLRNMKDVDDKRLVSKSNDLINAIYRLNLTEQRLILALISLINPKEDRNFTLYKIPIKDFQALIGRKGKSTYSDLKELTSNILDKSFTVVKPDGKLLQLNWLASAEYFGSHVELEISKKLKPLLLDLTGHYTKYKLKYILTLKNAYFIRLYELLKEWQYKKRERYFELAEFRAKLGIPDDKYKLYGHLKSRVILKAKKEINENTDIVIDFKEKRGSRNKVEGVFFFIQEKDVVEMASSDGDAVAITEFLSSVKDSNIYLELINFGVSEEKAKVLLSKYSEAQIKENIQYSKYQIDKGKVENPTGYLIRAIENNWKAQPGLFEKASKKAVPDRVDPDRRQEYQEYFQSKYDAFTANLSEEQCQEIEVEERKKMYRSGISTSKSGLYSKVLKGNVRQNIKKRAGILEYEDWLEQG